MQSEEGKPPMDFGWKRGVLAEAWSVLSVCNAGSSVQNSVVIGHIVIGIGRNNPVGYNALGVVLSAIHVVHAHSGHEKREQGQGKLGHVACGAGRCLSDNLAQSVMADHHENRLTPADGTCIAQESSR